MGKKIVYCYSNGTKTEHTVYIKKSTMSKECGNAKQVKIYEKTFKKDTTMKPFINVGGICDWTEKTKYITTLSLQ